MKQRMTRLLAALLVLLLLLPVLFGCVEDQESVEVDESDPTQNEQNDPKTDGGNDPETPPASGTQTTPFAEKSEKEKALHLWNVNRSEPQGVDSFTMTAEITGEGVMMGMPFTVSGSGLSVFAGLKDTADLFYYSEVNERINVQNGSFVSETVLKDGFADGRMFAYQEVDGDGDGVYSRINASDWKTYYQEKNEDSNVKLLSEHVRNATFTEAAESYTATLTEFTDSGLAAIKKAVGSDMSQVMGSPFVQVEVSVTTDKSFLPVAMSMTLLFEAETGEDTPFLEMAYTYGSYNETKAPSVNLAGYRVVSDLRVLERIDKAIDDLKSASSAQLEFFQLCSLWQGDLVVNEAESQVSVEFANSKNGYRFDLRDGEGVRSWYANGIQYVQHPGQTVQQNAAAELAAKSHVENNYIDPGHFSIYNVSNVLEENGDYNVIVSETDLSPYAEIIAAFSATEDDVRNKQSSFVITMEDGALTCYAYYVYFEVVTAQGTYAVDVITDYQVK